MVVFPPGKINLGLQITGKRADGYHDLVTCFYPLPWCDVLEIILSSSFAFTSTGLKIPGKPEGNLCIRAFELLQKDFDLQSVHIHLHKIIPMGAGLGGGSSDAGWTLRILNQLFDLKLSVERLKAYASKLGSDCAFFIEDRPALGSGRGEILSDIKLSLQGKYIVIVKPDVHVSTAEAYGGVTPKLPDKNLKEILEQRSVEEWRTLVKNDFEDSVFKKFPEIEKIKNSLYESGAQYAAMSGSGSSVFGIFSSQIDLSKEFRSMLYWSGRLGG